MITVSSLTGSFEAACTILIDWGINISLKRIERLTRLFVTINTHLLFQGLIFAPTTVLVRKLLSRGVEEKVI